MAVTVNGLAFTPYSASYTLTEAGTASDVVLRDVLADLTAVGFGAGYPLFNYLNNAALSATAASAGAAIADQAAARTLFRSGSSKTGWMATQHVVISIAPAALSVATSQILVDQNISGAAVGNFRLSVGASKAANGDTGTWVVTIELRHSIVA